MYRYTIEGPGSEAHKDSLRLCSKVKPNGLGLSAHMRSNASCRLFRPAQVAAFRFTVRTWPLSDSQSKQKGPQKVASKQCIQSTMTNKSIHPINHQGNQSAKAKRVEDEVILALRQQKIKLWLPPYYVPVADKSSHEAMNQLAIELSAEAPEDKGEVLKALYTCQFRSVRKHEAGKDRAILKSVVAKTVPPASTPYHHASGDMAKTAPPVPCPYSSPSSPVVVINGAGNADPTYIQPLREPADCCAKCLLITMIVFDSIALLFWLLQWFLWGMAPAISFVTFLVSVLLASILLCTKSGCLGRLNCVFGSHFLAAACWGAGIGCLAKSDSSGLTVTAVLTMPMAYTASALSVVYDPLYKAGMGLLIGAGVVMVVALADAGCSLCRLNRDNRGIVA